MSISCKKESQLRGSYSKITKESKAPLKALADTALSEKVIDALLKPIYDTMNLKPIAEINEEITFSRSDVKRFILNDEKFAALVVENQYPFAGASTGHCDLFIFQFSGNKWKISDFMLYAGSGGMYGNSGHLNKMLNVGKSAIGFSIAGGQTHMGTLYYDDLIFFYNKKLIKAGTIMTEYSYGDLEDVKDESRFCNEIEYSFTASDRDIYDLTLIKSNCLINAGNKVLDKITVPFDTDAQKYIIPNTFNGN